MQLKLNPNPRPAGPGGAPRTSHGSSGATLPASVQHQMEVAFGADFSSVRVHEGHQATLVGARAYTHGESIHFAPGAYQPHSPSGQQLLSHELAHVVQQRTSASPDVPQGMVNVDPSPAGPDAPVQL